VQTRVETPVSFPTGWRTSNSLPPSTRTVPSSATRTTTVVIPFAQPSISGPVAEYRASPSSGPTADTPITVV
jgi:hypothetical protein